MEQLEYLRQRHTQLLGEHPCTITFKHDDLQNLRELKTPDGWTLSRRLECGYLWLKNPQTGHWTQTVTLLREVMQLEKALAKAGNPRFNTSFYTTFLKSPALRNLVAIRGE